MKRGNMTRLIVVMLLALGTSTFSSAALALPPAPSPLPTATPTPSPSPTDSPSPMPTPMPTFMPTTPAGYVIQFAPATESPIGTYITPTPSPSSIPTPTTTPSPSPSPEPTVSPNPYATLAPNAAPTQAADPEATPVVQQLYVVGERAGAYRVRIDSYDFAPLEEVETHMRLTVVSRYQNMLHEPCEPSANMSMMLVLDNKYAYEFVFSHYQEPGNPGLAHQSVSLDPLGEIDIVWIVDVPNVVASSVDNRILRYVVGNEIYLSPLKPPEEITVQLEIPDAGSYIEDPTMRDISALSTTTPILPTDALAGAPTDGLAQVSATPGLELSISATPEPVFADIPVVTRGPDVVQNSAPRMQIPDYGSNRPTQVPSPIPTQNVLEGIAVSTPEPSFWGANPTRNPNATETPVVQGEIIW